MITFTKAIGKAIDDSMATDESVICYGLGVNDPKGIFGTTFGLENKYGGDRVFDTPTSENAMTGIGVGAAVVGFRPIMIHQRFDFFLLAMDQLVNSAAKWRFMFGGVFKVPLTIRLIVGQGWGQGPTHSQNLQSWLTHIPGLKVYSPSNVNDAYYMMRKSVEDDNPVILIEHRWLHNQKGKIRKNGERSALMPSIVREGKDLTIACWSNMVIEAIRASELLSKVGIDCEVIDIKILKPTSFSLLKKSVKKTKRLVVLDNSHETSGYSAEVVANVTCDLFGSLLKAPLRIACPDFASPTSYGMTKNYYNDYKKITILIEKFMGVKTRRTKDSDDGQHHDVPGEWFSGPF